MIGQPSKHPLRGCMTNAQTMAHLSELKPAINECLGYLAQLKRTVDEVAGMTGNIPPVSLGCIQSLLEEVRDVHYNRQEVLASASHEIFSSDVKEYERKWNTIKHSNPITGFFKKWALWKEMKKQGADVAWGNLDDLIEALVTLEKKPLHKQINAKANLENILMFYEKCQGVFEKLRAWLEVEHWEQLSIHELEENLKRWSMHLDLLKDWKQWCLIKEDLYQKNMGEIASLMEKDEVTLSELKNGYFARYFYEVANKQIANNPTADMFNGMLFDEKVSHYKDLAKRYQDLSKEELFNRLLERARMANINALWSNQLVILQMDLAWWHIQYGKPPHPYNNQNFQRMLSNLYDSY